MTDVAKKLELADAEVARLSNIITIQQKQIERLIECRDVAQTYQKQVAALQEEKQKWEDGCRANAEALKEACRVSDTRRLENLALKDRIRQLEDELVN